MHYISLSLILIIMLLQTGYCDMTDCKSFNTGNWEDLSTTFQRSTEIYGASNNKYGGTAEIHIWLSFEGPNPMITLRPCPDEIDPMSAKGDPNWGDRAQLSREDITSSDLAARLTEDGVSPAMSNNLKGISFCRLTITAPDQGYHSAYILSFDSSPNYAIGKSIIDVSGSGEVGRARVCKISADDLIPSLGNITTGHNMIGNRIEPGSGADCIVIEGSGKSPVLYNQIAGPSKQPGNYILWYRLNPPDEVRPWEYIVEEIRGGQFYVFSYEAEGQAGLSESSPQGFKVLSDEGVIWFNPRVDNTYTVCFEGPIETMAAGAIRAEPLSTADCARIEKASGTSHPISGPSKTPGYYNLWYRLSAPEGDRSWERTTQEIVGGQFYISYYDVGQGGLAESSPAGFKVFPNEALIWYSPRTDYPHDVCLEGPYETKQDAENALR